MTAHFSAAQRGALEEAARDRPNLVNRLHASLSFDGRTFAEGDRDFLDNVETCVYGQEDGLGVLLQTTVLGRLSPQQYEQTPCRVDYKIERDDGSLVPAPGFAGKIVNVRREGAFTSIVAATAGYEADRTPIGESAADDRQFVGVRPDTALFDMLSLLDYRGVELPRLAEPILYARTEPFSWTRMIKEAIEWVQAQGEVVAVDAPWNVASAYALREPPTETDWDIEEGRDLGVGELQDETPDDERFARVIVTRMLPTTNTAAGRESKMAEAKVDNGGRRVNPRSVKFLPYDAEGTPGDPSALPRSAYGIAYEEAIRLGNLPARLTVPLNYPPFWLRRGRGVSATSREYVQRLEGLFTLSTRYRTRAEQVVVDVAGKSGSVGGEGRVEAVYEDALGTPALGRTGG